jgi:CheY-like chemotaxis protein
VLVVEDDPAVLAMAVETLEGLGYQVTTADTAAAA